MRGMQVANGPARRRTPNTEESNVDRQEQEPPFQGGSQPVPERPPEVPKGGRGVMQTVVVILGVLLVLAAALWLLVPALAS